MPPIPRHVILRYSAPLEVDKTYTVVETTRGGSGMPTEHGIMKVTPGGWSLQFEVKLSTPNS